MGLKLKGIDVSYHQGNIDFAKVKAQGVKFVIIRATCSRHKDKKLDEYVKGCETYGIPYGFYHAMYATTRERALLEVDLFLKAIAPYRPTYPVYTDMEYWYDKDENIVNNISGELFTELGLLFTDKVEKAGYYAGIYTGKNMLENVLDYNKLKRFDIWLAQWNSKATWKGNFGLWQNNVLHGDMSVYGMPQADGLDQNIAYRDYPAIIKRLGLNKSAELTLESKIKLLKDENLALRTQVENLTEYNRNLKSVEEKYNQIKTICKE